MKELYAKFEVLSQIGSGGFSRVFKVESKEDGQIYALKILDIGEEEAEDVMSSKAYRDLKNEVAILKRLHSRTIVKVVDEMILDGSPCVLMEYVAGESLEKMIKEKGVLSTEEIEKVILDVSSALMICHNYQVPLDEVGLKDEASILKENAIIHNDIHPKNIIFSGGFYKLIDFGLSFSDVNRVAKSKIDHGMEEYKAPEKWLGKTIMPSSDIYSFGVVIFKCLTGRVPFEFNNNDPYDKRKETTEALLRGEIPDAWTIRKTSDKIFTSGPDYPYWIQMMMEKCLGLNPDDRFRSGKELNEYLHRGLKGQLERRWSEVAPGGSQKEEESQEEAQSLAEMDEEVKPIPQAGLDSPLSFTDQEEDRGAEDREDPEDRFEVEPELDEPPASPQPSSRTAKWLSLILLVGLSLFGLLKLNPGLLDGIMGPKSNQAVLERYFQLDEQATDQAAITQLAGYFSYPVSYYNKNFRTPEGFINFYSEEIQRVSDKSIRMVKLETDPLNKDLIKVTLELKMTSKNQQGKWRPVQKTIVDKVTFKEGKIISISRVR